MTTWTSMGMCDTFTVTPAPQKLEHYATNQKIKVLDKVAFVLLKATVDIKLDEWIEDNLVIALLGTAVSSGEITIGTAGTVERQVMFSGTNQFGANVEVILPHVFFSCDKVIEFIGDATWGNLDVTGDILLTDGMFGTINFLDSPSGAPYAPLDTDNYMLGKGNVYTAPLA